LSRPRVDAVSGQVKVFLGVDADLVVVRGDNGSHGAGEFWGFDPPRNLVDVIEDLLQQPNVFVERETVDDPREQLSPEAPLRTSQSRLGAMRRGEYHIVDANEPCWENAVLDELFGSQAASHREDGNRASADHTTRFWITTIAVLDGDSQLAMRFALDVGLWNKTITSTKGGGPSALFYESFESINVLPADGWMDELAEYHASMFDMHMTVVELDSDAYLTFFNHISSMTTDHTGPRS
jgi:hypothetical protein